MSVQSAKEDFTKNLKENRLTITKEDEKKAELLKDKVKSIKKSLNDLSLHNSYMGSQAFFEDRHYKQPNLFIWAIIVIASLFTFYYFCLTDEGKALEEIKVLTEPGLTDACPLCSAGRSSFPFNLFRPFPCSSVHIHCNMFILIFRA